jgi:predicted metal-dependent hydrolase
MPDLKSFMARAPEGWRLDIIYKKIRHIYFRVYPDKKLVKVSAPYRIKNSALNAVISAKSGWLLKQISTPRPVPAASPEMQTKDVSFFKGKSYPLLFLERPAPPRVVLDEDRGILVYTRPGATEEKKNAVLSQWYRNCLKDEIRDLLERWEPVIGVATEDFGVKKMKTRWGSCNTQARRIWINLALIRLSPCYLEYVLVHELIHLLERYHNQRFYGFMDRFLPRWKELKTELNRYSLRMG